jgi:hypothetical protein
MFFRDAETPRALWLNTRGGAAEATRLREAARANTEGPVIALEPENFIDITRQFYLLPILSAQRVENESAHEARLLEVVCAPAQQAPAPAADPVNHPAHYTAGGIETIDFIEAKGLDYLLGNTVKYIARAGKKGDGDSAKELEDLRKGRWYLDRAIARRGGK